MKKTSLLSAIMGLSFIGSASAADITVFYSPTCPHCHHAREFISSTLIYEYPELKVTEVNVMEPSTQELFQETLTKCGFESGGVPVIVVGDKCEQGYAEFMKDTLREHVEVDMTDEQKAVAAENKKALAEDAVKFKSEHADRTSAISEYTAAAAENVEKKNEQGSVVWFWGLLIVLVAGLGYVLVRKDKKK
ncbi:MAG: hypothetical protein IKW57_02155 [Alphaproteobacteria bacterium]|nr:hypothetical protein [Alphaproteobacteria bacterium]